MPEDPLAPILGQLGELLKLIEKNAGKPVGPIDPAIEKQLTQAEELVNRFAEIVDDEIKREGKSESGAYHQLEKQPLMYTETEKKILKRCRDLGVNAVVLRVGLLRAVRDSTQPKKREMGKNTKKSIQKRRNKFKGMNGGQMWKKL